METKKSPKVANFFVCNFCDYNTSKKSDFNKHLLTAKHKNNANGNILETKKSQKSLFLVLHDLSCNVCNQKFSSRRIRIKIMIIPLVIMLQMVMC